MLTLELLLLGKTKDGYIDAGIIDFSGRLRRFAHLHLSYIRVPRHSGRSESEIKSIESRLLDKHCSSGSYRIALDGSGTQMSSEEFAALISRLEDGGKKSISFIIGGPLGLAEAQLQTADFILSLSNMTFTHDMVRLLLLEQLYRAFMIQAGTKYHK